MEHVYGIYGDEHKNMGNPEGKYTFGNPGKDGRIILKYIFKNIMGGLAIIMEFSVHKTRGIS